MLASVAKVGAVLGALALSFTITATPAEAASRRTHDSYFGMHYAPIGYEGTFPATRSVGSVRLWDTGTAWRQINPAPGVFHWGTLDRAVTTARAHGASVTLVLGQTPTWAARNTWQNTVYGESAGSFPTDHARWVEYVQAVATRYKGRITAYETWNEANLTMYSGMTPREMARLQSLAYRTIKRIAPSAKVIAPSVTARGGTGLRFLKAFARAGGFRYADAINVHAYPEPDGGPERAVALIRHIRRSLAKLGVHKPVWDTEINYGLPWGGNGMSTPLSARQQKAYVERTYLLHRDAGVKRVYWYAWQEADFLGVDVYNGSAAAQGLSEVRAGMKGRFLGCTHHGPRYRCKFGKRIAHWNVAKRGFVHWRSR